MLKKILLASAILLPNCLFAFSDISAEEAVASLDQSKTDSATIWNSWFISVGAGAQLMNEDSALSTHGEETSLPGSNVNEWFIPNSGIRTMHSGLSLKGTRRNEMFSADFSNGNQLGTVNLNPMNLHADILYNGSNLICGYNEKRVWKVIPFNNNVRNQMNWDDFVTQTGHEMAQSKLPVKIKLDIQGTFLGDRQEDIHFYHPSDSVSATLGFRYNLPDYGWKNIQISIQNDSRWKEHCNQMIYLNQK